MAPTLVPFESSYQVMPPVSAIHWVRCAQTPEAAHARRQVFGTAAHGERQQCRRHRIFQIVRPGKAQVVASEERARVAARSVLPDAVAVEVAAVFDAAAHRKAPPPRRHLELGDRRVVEVEHRRVAGMLAQEDALLGAPIGGDVRVAIEVVGREVEQRRGGRAEALDRLELEARQLDDEDAPRGPLDAGRQGPADVAADLDGEARRPRAGRR